MLDYNVYHRYGLRMSRIGTNRKCKRCGFQWAQRITGTPKMCPSCKTRLWDKERKVKAEA